MTYNDYTEMPVWQLAMEIVKSVYELTEKLPKREDYALCGQLREAAVSIAGNIAEGFGRWHKKDKINFYFFLAGVHAKLEVIYTVEPMSAILRTGRWSPLT